MTLSTAFTELFGVRHPIALAPMGGSAGGALAAAVSNGGGPEGADVIVAQGTEAGGHGARRGWSTLPPAADLVGLLAAQAEEALRLASAGLA